jgi:hypothetical protein
MIEKTTKFKVPKEKTAVELLLDKINSMQEEIDFLKCHVQIYDYNMLRNVPNPIVRINSQPDGLLIEYHD